MEIALFFANALGMLVDRLKTGGCLLAGIFIKNYWGALSAGVAWILILQIARIMPAAKVSYLSMIIVYAIFAAIIATSIAFGVGKLFRKTKSEETDIESGQSDAQ